MFSVRKPIDHDIAKIKEVIDALEGTNLKYQVGFNRRFDHNFESLQQAVAAVRLVNLRSSRSLPAILSRLALIMLRFPVACSWI